MAGEKIVKYKNGKFITSDEGGGGGSSTFAGLYDVNFTNLDDGQIPKYDAQSQKWVNSAESGGTVTDVKVDGVSVVNQQGVAEIPAIPTVNVDDVNVNGTSVVDVNGVAQITSYKEVTQEQYDALPASKTSDGVAYFIKNAGDSGGVKHKYSTQEQVVGTWIDGKPIYEKTFIVDPIDSANEVNVLHNIANIEKCIKYEGFLWNINEGVIESRFIPQNYRQDFDIYAVSVYSVTNTKLKLVYGSWLKSVASIFKAYITIRYTKTTD